MQVPRIDKVLGICNYATKNKGLSGSIKNSIDDFIVEEVLVDGSIAKIDKRPNFSVLSSSLKINKYLLCVLIKRNRDTLLGIRYISSELKIDENKICFAGIKDAKAITAQYITIEDSLIENITSHKLSDLTLYPIGYVREHLSSYYLLGNNFKININNLDSSELEIKTTIKKTIEQLNEIGGIPNFFGYQRFGTIRPITHLVGKAIIKDDFKKAILTYLVNCSKLENPYSREARKDLARTQDFKKSLHKFPKQLRFERLILNHLSKKPNDFTGAFKRLPFKLQMLFIQAYQSYLYNLFLSKRIEQGFSFKKATIGDFAVNIDRSGLPMPQTGKLVNIENIEKINKSIKLEKMCIALPLVGFKQGFSSGKIGEMQKNIFEIEGITPENFRVKKMPRISGRGNLRAINIPLKKFKLKKVFSESNRSENRININFMLNKGSYATILLREILKPLDPVKAGF